MKSSPKNNIFGKLLRKAVIVCGLSVSFSAQAAGVFSVAPFSGDADSGVSLSSNYTLTLNTASDVSTIVNGVTFQAAGASGTTGGYGWNFDTPGGLGTITGISNTATGGMNALLTSFFYDQSGAAVTLTLTGLTSGLTYRTTFYNAGFGAVGGAINNIAVSDGGSYIGFDENFTGNGNPNLLSYEFLASSSSISYQFAPFNAQFRLYGLSNQVVPEPGTVAMVGLGIAMIGYRYIRRKR